MFEKMLTGSPLLFSRRFSLVCFSTARPPFLLVFTDRERGTQGGPPWWHRLDTARPAMMETSMDFGFFCFSSKSESLALSSGSLRKQKLTSAGSEKIMVCDW